MIAKCPCEHCGVNIEFATEEFLSGSSVSCPKCGKETPIFVSPQAKPVQKSATPTPIEAKCSCQHCGKQIVFDVEHIGQIADCPHCGLETKLVISKVPVRAVSQAIPSDAVPQYSGLENNFVVAGYLTAVLLPIAGFFIGLYLMTQKESGHGAACMGLSILAGIFWLAVIFR